MTTTTTTTTTMTMTMGTESESELNQESLFRLASKTYRERRHYTKRSSEWFIIQFPLAFTDDCQTFFDEDGRAFSKDNCKRTRAWIRLYNNYP
jgi:hypothetical protein